jgi:hypothetical protein
MTWLKQTLTVLGTMALVMALATVIFPTRASALVAALVRDVDNPARDTFQAIFESTCAGGVGAVSCNGLTLPATNGSGAAISMVVIEYVSTSCNGPLAISNYSNAQLTSILTSSPGAVQTTTSTSGYFLQLLFSPSSGFSQQTRMYAAPGSTLVTFTGANSSSCDVSISGYFVTP